MRGIILEGITGSGKTCLLRALTPALTAVYPGPIWIAPEILTERILEPLATATAAEARKHVERHIELLEHLSALEQEGPPRADRDIIFILERFHLSIALHIPGANSSVIENWETRLQRVGTTLVGCFLPEESILQNSIRDPLQRRSEKWGQYLKTLGNSEEALLKHFSDEQNRLARLFATTKLPNRDLVIDLADIPSSVAKIHAILGVAPPRKGNTRKK